MGSWTFTGPQGHLLTCTYIHPAFDDRRHTAAASTCTPLAHQTPGGRDLGRTAGAAAPDAALIVSSKDSDGVRVADRQASNAAASAAHTLERPLQKDLAALSSCVALRTGWASSAPRPVRCPPSMSAAAHPEEGARRWSIGHVLRTAALALFFGGAASFTRRILATLPPDFIARWRKLLADQPEDSAALLDNPQPTIIYDRHGTVIATIVSGGIGTTKEGGDADALLQPIEIPTAMWQAIVAHEDRRFFDHEGVDIRGLSRAIISLGQSGGGSTITQQLVKNVFLTNERTWSRKLVEILLSLVIEKQMSKLDILHLYINKIYWGHGVYGIKAAAALYFGKHPSMLTVGECAMLAGIVPAPELYSPLRDPSRGKKSQARVLKAMVDAGYLDLHTCQQEARAPIHLSSGKAAGAGPWRAPFFISEVLHQLKQQYGEAVLHGRGLQVTTTLDLPWQEVAEAVLKEGCAEYDEERLEFGERDVARIREKLKRAENERMRGLYETVLGDAVAEVKAAGQARMEGAMVVMDQQDGAVRVLVGGRDYYESSYNRATEAERPSGSTFKPVVYLTALAEGYKARHPLVDEPYTIGGFTPENFDRKFRGKVTLEQALVKSMNVPTVKLCAEVGIDKVVRLARALGIERRLPHELAVSLGMCEVTPLQLANLYATIANGGTVFPSYLITKIINAKGQIDWEHKVEACGQAEVGEKAMPELRRLLQAVIERGTGRAAKIGRPACGKTGTSDGFRDVWFAGFTPQMTAVVWLGYDNNFTVGGTHPATGASHAAPLWKRFMMKVHERMPVIRFEDHFKHQRSFAVMEAAPRLLRAADDDEEDEQPARADQAAVYAPFDPREPVPWRHVWDWEVASSLWSERERMGSYVAQRAASMKSRGLAVPRLDEERPWDFYGETEAADQDDATTALCVIDPIEAHAQPPPPASFPGLAWHGRRRGRGSSARRMKEGERSPLSPLFGRLYEKWVWAEQNVRSNGRVPKDIRTVAEFEEWHGAMLAQQPAHAAHELTFNSCVDTRPLRLEAPNPLLSRPPALPRFPGMGAGSVARGAGRPPVLSSGWAQDPWEAEPSSPRRLSISHSRKKIRGWEPGSPRRGVSPAASPRGSPGRSPPGTPAPHEAAAQPPSGQLIAEAVKQVKSREAAEKQREEEERRGRLPLLQFGRRSKARAQEEPEEEGDDWRAVMEDSFASKVANRWGTGEDEPEPSPAHMFRLPNVGQSFNLGSLNNWKEQLQRDKEATETTSEAQAPSRLPPKLVQQSPDSEATTASKLPHPPTSLTLPSPTDNEAPTTQLSPRRSRRRSRRRVKVV
ncbi:penicillin-binding protein [Klebsormidium nitens]|uniref:peptidoglycan glycosyltransferase n=1 Tax=Klebsormidium nitens TaxID=105231 RepID=A0A1Y1IF93_KLENI|nr:penicillin-binding protein [Klebsormidium nitens]|eukprot:GAQ89555.1 penicillin-binding protein [Klebsormidium nitens]